MRGRSALMVAAVMGLMGGAMAPTLAAGSHATIEKAVMRTRQPRGTTLREIFGGGTFGGRSSARRAGYGWTNRHAQRVSLKKRNQARHRAAGRGGR